MASFSDTVVDDSGYQRPVPNARVYLFNRDGTLAATTSANPATTDDFGVYQFTVADPGGFYIADARIGGVTIAKGGVTIGVPSEAVGPSGPASSTYTTLAALKAAAASNKSYVLAAPTGADGGIANGTFVYRTDGAPYTAGANVVALSSVPLTTGALVRQEAAALSYGRNVNIALPLDRSIPRSLGYFGVDPFTTASQHGKINDAFYAASVEGLKLIGHPDAVYRRDGQLYIDGANTGAGQKGMEFDGQGCSFYALSNAEQAIVLRGAGPKAKNFTNRSAATARQSGFGRSGVLVYQATDFALTDVSSGGVEAGKGPASIGFMFYGAKRGTMTRLYTTGSFADNYHCTGGCEDLTFFAPTAVGGGDDGFAVVGYVGDNVLNKRISVFGLYVADNTVGRGIAIVGGNDCHFYAPRLYRTATQAVLMEAEIGDSTTFGARGCSVRELYAEDCCTGLGNMSFSGALIRLAGRSGSQTLADGTVVPYVVRDSFISGRARGMGARANAAVDSDNAFLLNPGWDIRFENMLGPNADRVALKMGGQDAYGRVFVDGCRGTPFLMGQNLTGDPAFDKLGATGTHQGDTSLTSMIHGDGANNWNSLYADFAQFRSEGGGLSFTSNIDMGKFNWRRAVFNSANVVHS